MFNDKSFDSYAEAKAGNGLWSVELIGSEGKSFSEPHLKNILESVIAAVDMMDTFDVVNVYLFDDDGKLLDQH